MRKGLLLVLVMLMVSCLMAAAAYSSAVVRNDADMTTVKTTGATLTLKPGTGVGNEDAVAYLDSNNVLELDFDKAFGGTQLGLQGDSDYTWDELFWVWNRSNDDVEFTVKAENMGNYIDVGLPDATPRTQWWHWQSDSEKFVADGNNTGAQIRLNANSSVPILVRFQIEQGAALGNVSGQLIVEANAVN